MKLVLFSFTALVAAAAAEPVPATIDKTGNFRADGVVVNAGKAHKGSADVQHIRWAKHKGYERLVLDFHAWEGYEKFGKPTATIATPSYFRANIEQGPYRTHVQVASRGCSALSRLPALGESNLLRRIYRVPVFDDATVGFAIEARQPVEVEVFELHDPARIVIDMRPAKGHGRTVYGVRSKATDDMGDINELSELAERLAGQDPRILMADDGKSYCVEATSSYRNWKAKMLLEGLPAKLSDKLFVEERSEAAAPGPGR